MVGCHPAKRKGNRLHSLSGHMSGLQVQSQSGQGTYERQSINVSLFLSLKINNKIVKKQNSNVASSESHSSKLINMAWGSWVRRLYSQSVSEVSEPAGSHTVQVDSVSVVLNRRTPSWCWRIACCGDNTRTLECQKYREESSVTKQRVCPRCAAGTPSRRRRVR